MDLLKEFLLKHSEAVAAGALGAAATEPVIEVVEEPLLEKALA